MTLTETTIESIRQEKDWSKRKQMCLAAASDACRDGYDGQQCLAALLEELTAVLEHYEQRIRDREHDMGRSQTGGYTGPGGITTDRPTELVCRGGEWYTPGAR